MPEHGRDVWMLLVLLLGHWARQGRAGQCQDGEMRTVWGGGTKCCPKCTWTGENSAPCAATKDPDCKCPPGHSCADEPCYFCLRLPRCQPGQQPARIGKNDFRFECRPCETGTYSSGRNGWCHNWTDCESSGFITLREGNSTHNSVCGFPVRPLEPAWIPLEFPSSTILAILTAVAVFVLILLTFLLHFCIWTLRKDKKIPPGDLGHNFPWLLPPLQLPHQGEESYSIQFPEEEHGEKTTEEKLSVFSLKVDRELR